MADKDATERRVYNLPPDLLERLRAYQVSQGITSEAEAARRLLDSALQMREDVHAILRALKTKFQEDKDLRVLAAEVAKHSLVSSVNISDEAIEFRLRSGQRGRLESAGVIQFADRDMDDGYWCDYPKPPPAGHRAKNAAPTWEPAKGGGDLDDDIPF